MHRTLFKTPCLLLLVLSLGPFCSALNILSQTPQGGRGDLSFFGSAWTSVTNHVISQGNVIQQVASFDNLSGGGFDAVWVNQELNNTLSVGEISSLQTYLAAGNKAVLIGENNLWTNWNDSLMVVVGGLQIPNCVTGTANSVSSDPFFVGVNGVNFACSSTINTSVGAPVMVYNTFAAVYQVGLGEALVILESNLFDNTRFPGAGNVAFTNAILGWLGAPTAAVLAQNAVPEPGTWLLSLSTLFLCFFLRKK